MNDESGEGEGESRYEGCHVVTLSSPEDDMLLTTEVARCCCERRGRLIFSYVVDGWLRLKFTH